MLDPAGSTVSAAAGPRAARRARHGARRRPRRSTAAGPRPARRRRRSAGVRARRAGRQRLAVPTGDRARLPVGRARAPARRRRLVRGAGRPPSTGSTDRRTRPAALRRRPRACSSWSASRPARACARTTTATASTYLDVPLDRRGPAGGRRDTCRCRRDRRGLASALGLARAGVHADRPLPAGRRPGAAPARRRSRCPTIASGCTDRVRRAAPTRHRAKVTAARIAWLPPNDGSTVLVPAWQFEVDGFYGPAVVAVDPQCLATPARRRSGRRAAGPRLAAPGDTRGRRARVGHGDRGRDRCAATPRPPARRRRPRDEPRTTKGRSPLRGAGPSALPGALGGRSAERVAARAGARRRSGCRS